MSHDTNQLPVEQRPRAGSYGEYLDDLLREMQRRPSLAYLAAYLRDYGRERALLPYTARDATAPDVKAIHAKGCDWTWHQRQWDIREQARAIIEGAEPWPRRLMAWKTWHEMRYYHGASMKRPAWLDESNKSTARALPSKRRRARALQRELNRRRGRA